MQNALEFSSDFFFDILEDSLHIGIKKEKTDQAAYDVDISSISSPYISLSHTPNNKNYFLSGNFAPIQKEMYYVPPKDFSYSTETLCETENQFDSDILLAQPSTSSFSSFKLHQGALPQDLNGLYLRNGPNPQLAPRYGYHWFDGDGMVHATRVSDQKITYANRWIRTTRFQVERNKQKPFYPKIGDLKGWRGLATVLISKAKFLVQGQPQHASTANTGIEFHHGNIFALNESDTPYLLRIVDHHDQGLDLKTVGRASFRHALNRDTSLLSPPNSTDSNNLQSDNNYLVTIPHFSAHPKICPRTGELIFFGYNIEKKPYLHAGILSKDGILTKYFPIDIPYPVMMHDFAITENYMIFMDLPLQFTPQLMVRDNKLPFNFINRDSRFGFLPRSASSADEIIWIDDLPPGMIFHTVNAWEEPEKHHTDGSRLPLIKLYACRMDEPDIMSFGANEDFHHHPPRKVSEHGLQAFQGTLYEFTFDLKNRTGSQRQLFPEHIFVDFPRINPNYVGIKHRFAYLATMKFPDTKCDGVMKVDLQASSPEQVIMHQINFGVDCYGGECVFIPKDKGQNGGDDPVWEDAGYLVTYVHDEAHDKSYFWLADAQNLLKGPISMIELPQRIPYGFHGNWINEEQLLEHAHI